MIDAKSWIGHCDVLMFTLDSLRFDVAAEAFAEGLLPHLETLLPQGFEARQTPGNFTLAAHLAFFAGFLPTLSPPGDPARLFAAARPGSRSIAPTTFVFSEATWPEALAARGYSTLCIGGVAFFDRRTAQGSILPGLFAEALWQPAFGPGSRNSARRQVEAACSAVRKLSTLPKPLLLFVNFSATHRPTQGYLEGARHESPASQRAALLDIDRELPPLLDLLRERRRNLLAIVCADHGEAFGEDGFTGHRCNHPTVLTVPYAENLLPWESPAP